VTHGTGNASLGPEPSRRTAVKRLSLIALVALAACENPMIGASMVVDSQGASIGPVVSGDIGNATVTIESR